MSVQWRVRPGRLFRAGWPRVSAAIMMLGVLLSGAGLVLALTATPVEAATMTCGATLASTPLVPGAAGSCTFTDGAIRISRRAAALPDWVIDYLLMHELAHLEHSDHGPAFHELENRYPLSERARGYLMALDSLPLPPSA